MFARHKEEMITSSTTSITNIYAQTLLGFLREAEAGVDG